MNLTTSNFKLDDLEQYDHTENIHIHNVRESTNMNDDGEDALFEVAKVLNIKLTNCNIQRVLRWENKKLIQQNPAK